MTVVKFITALAWVLAVTNLMVVVNVIRLDEWTDMDRQFTPYAAAVCLLSTAWLIGWYLL